MFQSKFSGDGNFFGKPLFPLPTDRCTPTIDKCFGSFAYGLDRNQECPMPALAEILDSGLYTNNLESKSKESAVEFGTTHSSGTASKSGKLIFEKSGSDVTFGHSCSDGFPNT